MFLQHFWYWFEIHTGTVNESGPYYGFWSGFGSDLGEITLVTALVMGARHLNCAEKGCWRPGHPVAASGIRSCHKHHPTHPRKHRNGSVVAMHSDRIR